KIYAHEAEQGAEIQQLGAQIIAAPGVIQCERGDERDSANQNDIVAGNTSARIHETKKLAQDGIVAAHAIEKTASTEVGAHAGADSGEQERNCHHDEEGPATDQAGDVREGIFEAGESGGGFEPNQLGHVNLQRCE